jgi:hypothetical protein
LANPSFLQKLNASQKTEVQVLSGSKKSICGGMKIYVLDQIIILIEEDLSKMRVLRRIVRQENYPQFTPN